MLQCVYAHSREELRKYEAQKILDSNADEGYNDDSEDEAGDVNVYFMADSSDEEKDDYVSELVDNQRCFICSIFSEQ